MRLPASLAAAVAVVLLAGCQPAPPPPPSAPILPLPPPVPPVPPPLPRESVAWHFTAGTSACTASANGRTAELRITLQAGHPVVFALDARRAPTGQDPAGLGALRFQGAAGAWSAAARIDPGGRAVAVLPLNDKAVGRIALLLAGGSLTPVGAGGVLPVLLLPPADAAGRAWFACARGLL